LNKPTGNSARRDLPLATLMATSAQLLGEVSEGRSQSELLAYLDTAEKAPVQSITAAVLRQWGLLQTLRKIMLPRPPAPIIGMLIDVGLSNLVQQTQTPSQRQVFVVVDQAVSAVDILLEGETEGGLKAQKGLVNAVLRRFLREQPALMAQAQQEAFATENVPPWWADAVRRNYPGALALQVLAASRQAAPMSLRVNQSEQTLQQAHDSLTAHDLPFQEHPMGALQLLEPCAVELIPQFQEGAFSVQDAGAQLAGHLLLEAMLSAPSEPMSRPWRVLDACAAPGGKTGHLVELLTQQERPAQLLAMDYDAQRLDRVRENLQRIGTTAQVRTKVVTGDAAKPGPWWDNQAFDAILLDAPCSASGIVARHPDIPWLRRRGDLATLGEQQRRLLAALWPTLAPGGTLLYATCSLFAEENENSLQAFSSTQANCQRLPTAIAPAWREHFSWAATANGLGLQLLPCTATSTRIAHDGFYYALLRKMP
jgi:16S rRNA (cytosine967-C5)-methyltransferase